MILSSRFVYIHMPKTGGTFVREALKTLFSKCGLPYSDDRTRKHAGVGAIPPAYRHLPVLATIRNPYDHYVSYYEFGWWKSHRDDTFDDVKIRRKFAHYPELSFEEYMHSIFDWTLLSNSQGDSEVAATFDKQGIGPLTLEYIRFYAKPPQALLHEAEPLDSCKLRNCLAGIRFMRTDQLNKQLQNALAGFGFEPREVAFIGELGKLLPEGSARTPSQEWPQYYNRNLMSRVRSRERLLFEVFPEFDALL